MKSKSVLFLLVGIAIGSVAGVLFAPQKTLKKKKGPVKKLTKANKSLKEKADKYRKELNVMDEGDKPRASKATKSNKGE